MDLEPACEIMASAKLAEHAPECGLVAPSRQFEMDAHDDFLATKGMIAVVFVLGGLMCCRTRE